MQEQLHDVEGTGALGIKVSPPVLCICSWTFSAMWNTIVL